MLNIPSLCSSKGCNWSSYFSWVRDGSFQAFDGNVYIRWEVDCQHSRLEDYPWDYDSNLLIAKSRVTPLCGLSIPRSALSGSVLITRLLKSCVKALQSDETMKPTCIIPLVDSKCTVSVLEISWYAKALLPSQGFRNN